MSNQEVGLRNAMPIVPASVVTNLANATTISVSVLAVAFMLRFLIALIREQQAGRVGCRLEYRIDSTSSNVANGQIRSGFSVQSPSTRVNSNERAYDRWGFLGGTPQSVEETRLTLEYRFTDSSRQEPNRP